MKLMITQYVEDCLAKAQYEYDAAAKRWIGWVEGVSGVCSQAKTVEGARAELIEMLEEQLLLSIGDGSLEIKRQRNKVSPFYAQTTVAA